MKFYSFHRIPSLFRFTLWYLHNDRRPFVEMWEPKEMMPCRCYNQPGPSALILAMRMSCCTTFEPWQPKHAPFEWCKQELPTITDVMYTLGIPRKSIVHLLIPVCFWGHSHTHVCTTLRSWKGSLHMSKTKWRVVGFVFWGCFQE